MTVLEIISELEKCGDKQTKNTLLKHGAREPFFGVKIADMKKILKKTKTNHELSLELYKTGNSDAMYLAGLMADKNKITESQLNEWVDQAYWYYLSEYTVPWVAAETDFGFDLGLKWIQSEKENVAAAGWSTLSNYAGLHPDNDLDVNVFSRLLDQVADEIHSAKNRVRYTMNGFIIAIGAYVKDLTDKALIVSEKIGRVDVEMNGTACKVPLATEYITKIIERRAIGKKRKSARC